MTKKKTLRQREVEALEQQTRILEAQHNLIQRTQKQSLPKQYMPHNPIAGVLPKGVKLPLLLWTHAMAFHPMQMPIQCFMQGLSVTQL